MPRANQTEKSRLIVHLNGAIEYLNGEIEHLNGETPGEVSDSSSSRSKTKAAAAFMLLLVIGGIVAIAEDLKRHPHDRHSEKKGTRTKTPTKSSTPSLELTRSTSETVSRLSTPTKSPTTTRKTVSSTLTTTSTDRTDSQSEKITVSKTETKKTPSSTATNQPTKTPSTTITLSSSSSNSATDSKTETEKKTATATIDSASVTIMFWGTGAVASRPEAIFNGPISCLNGPEIYDAFGVLEDLGFSSAACEKMFDETMQACQEMYHCNSSAKPETGNATTGPFNVTDGNGNQTAVGQFYASFKVECPGVNGGADHREESRKRIQQGLFNGTKSAQQQHYSRNQSNPTFRK